MKFPFAVVCLLFLTTVVTESSAFTNSFSTCALCKYTIGELDKSLEDRSLKIDQIGKTLNDYCGKLSGAAADSCHAFASQLTGLYIYAYTVATASMEGFCEGTMQCIFSEPRIFTQQGGFELRCNICKRNIANMVKHLTPEEYTESTVKAIKAFCPGAWTLVQKPWCAKTATWHMKMAYANTVKSLIPEAYCKMTGNCVMSVK